ncbi:hypothetical protein ml_374 [Mollivirus sibericum]|uniref:hypothetical protein n=1 Tax=Mollivirus sibericum TaxID=1678078 RepID=UPI0006B2DD56|nr:hypothetical protein ml_374 [Mollivirus sibericum]ALD62176.1 hypothetical protein ml_374 [Mollivirus sibericum]
MIRTSMTRIDKVAPVMARQMSTLPEGGGNIVLVMQVLSSLHNFMSSPTEHGDLIYDHKRDVLNTLQTYLVERTAGRVAVSPQEDDSRDIDAIQTLLGALPSALDDWSTDLVCDIVHRAHDTLQVIVYGLAPTPYGHGGSHSGLSIASSIMSEPVPSDWASNSCSSSP